MRRSARGDLSGGVKRQVLGQRRRQLGSGRAGSEDRRRGSRVEWREAVSTEGQGAGTRLVEVGACGGGGAGHPVMARTTNTRLERPDPPRAGIGEGWRSTGAPSGVTACRNPDGLTNDPALAEPSGGGDGGRPKSGWMSGGGDGDGVAGTPRRPRGERVGGGAALQFQKTQPCRGRGGEGGGGGNGTWRHEVRPPPQGEDGRWDQEGGLEAGRREEAGPGREGRRTQRRGTRGACSTSGR